MYIKELKGARPVDYIFETTSYCPPDCGGQEYDEGDYVPHCPKCHISLDNEIKFCSECGTKLYWGYGRPQIIRK